MLIVYEILQALFFVTQPRQLLKTLNILMLVLDFYANSMGKGKMFVCVMIFYLVLSVNFFFVKLVLLLFRVAFILSLTYFSADCKLKEKYN